MLLCFVDPILGNLYGTGVVPRVDIPQTTCGVRISTLHLKYVAGYTGPLLFLFERTHTYPVDNQGLLPWRLHCVGESNVRSASSVRCDPDSNRQVCSTVHPLTGVLLCFIKPISGNRYGPGVPSRESRWGLIHDPRSCPSFLGGFESTQLARQVQQE